MQCTFLQRTSHWEEYLHLVSQRRRESFNYLYGSMKEKHLDETPQFLVIRCREHEPPSRPECDIYTSFSRSVQEEGEISLEERAHTGKGRMLTCATASQMIIFVTDMPTESHCTPRETAKWSRQLFPGEKSAS